MFKYIYKDKEEIIIHRKGRESVMVISLDEYNGLKETNYLLHSPANRKYLLESLEQLRKGRGVERELLEWDSFGVINLEEEYLTDEHRLVYEVENDTLYIVSCKYHY